jgi:FAD/FMN-containing dehydrogenase
MSNTTAIWNWSHEVVTTPRAIVRARTVDEVVRAVADRDRYPSPVRAHGARHSVTACIDADGGTVVEMKELNRILEIGPDFVRVEAGARFYDVAHELRRYGRQFFVNTEIGNLTMGAAACASTKDSSMPGELGQVSSYCTAMKLVTSSGEVVEVDESDPELLQAARSGFGLLGIVVEATLRIRPLETLAVEHRLFELDEFVAALPGLLTGDRSVMLFVFPFQRRVLTELRRYAGPPDDLPPWDWYWQLRNYLWRTGVPAYSHAVTAAVPWRPVRFALISLANRSLQLAGRTLRDRTTTPTSQIIDYPASGWERFSIWAFPEEQYADTLREYFDWARQYYRRTGYRTNLPDTGYRIVQDQGALLSYAWDGNALTLDPSSTGDVGWLEFLRAFNEFCADRNGSPLLNQTPQLEAGLARRSLGERLDRFEAIRRRLDPDDRFLSGYFRPFLQP